MGTGHYAGCSCSACIDAERSDACRTCVTDSYFDEGFAVERDAEKEKKMTEEKTKTISSDPQIAALEAALAESRRQVEALTARLSTRDTIEVNRMAADKYAVVHRENAAAREWLLERLNPELTPGTYASTDTLQKLLERYDERTTWTQVDKERTCKILAQGFGLAIGFDKPAEVAREAVKRFEGALDITDELYEVIFGEKNPLPRTWRKDAVQKLDIQALYGEREEVHQLCAAATGASHAKIYDAVLALRDKYYALKARIARPLTNLACRLEDVGARCTQLGTRVENFEHKAVINVAFTYQQLVEANREAIDQLSPAVRAIFKDGFWPMPRGFETASSNWRENEGAVQMSAPLRPDEGELRFLEKTRQYLEKIEFSTDPPAPYEHVDHPPHYQKHPSGLEAIDLCERLSFNYGNAIKYLWRAGKKGNALEDLKKARWYLLRYKNQRGWSAGVLESETSALIDRVVETDGGILGAVLRGVNKGKYDGIDAKIKLIDVAIQDLSGGSLGKESK